MSTPRRAVELRPVVVCPLGAHTRVIMDAHQVRSIEAAEARADAPTLDLCRWLDLPSSDALSARRSLVLDGDGRSLLVGASVEIAQRDLAASLALPALLAPLGERLALSGLLPDGDLLALVLDLGALLARGQELGCFESTSDIGRPVLTTENGG